MHQTLFYIISKIKTINMKNSHTLSVEGSEGNGFGYLSPLCVLIALGPVENVIVFVVASAVMKLKQNYWDL